MRLGSPLIVKCPFCGEEDELPYMISGNNFGATYWSDNKVESPMAIRLDPAIRCRRCRKYYLLSRQRTRQARNCMPVVMAPHLSYPEAVEAYRQFKEQGFHISLAVRVMLLQAYNDYYYRDNDAGEHAPTEDDVQFIHGILLWLAKRWPQNDLFRAELYREAGLMKRAIKLLTDWVPERRCHQVIREEILRRAMENDTRVFQVECAFQRRFRPLRKKAVDSTGIPEQKRLPPHCHDDSC